MLLSLRSCEATFLSILFAIVEASLLFSYEYCHIKVRQKLWIWLRTWVWVQQSIMCDKRKNNVWAGTSLTKFISPSDLLIRATCLGEWCLWQDRGPLTGSRLKYRIQTSVTVLNYWDVSSLGEKPQKMANGAVLVAFSLTHFHLSTNHRFADLLRFSVNIVDGCSAVLRTSLMIGHLPWGIGIQFEKWFGRKFTWRRWRFGSIILSLRVSSISKTWESPHKASKAYEAYYALARWLLCRADTRPLNLVNAY